MGRIIAIAGLPASGKTHYAKELRALYGEVGTVDMIDDPIKWDIDVEPVLKANSNNTVIITDPWFCVDRNRVLAEDKFRKLGFTVEWIFFENDPEACDRNDVRRGTDRYLDIKWFSTQYTIPEGANVLPVWKGSKSLTGSIMFAASM